MDSQLLELLAKHDSLFVKLGVVLGNVSPYGKTQKQRTKENRARGKQRREFKREIRDTEHAIVVRCFDLRTQLSEETPSTQLRRGIVNILPKQEIE